MQPWSLLLTLKKWLVITQMKGSWTHFLRGHGDSRTIISLGRNVSEFPKLAPRQIRSEQTNTTLRLKDRWLKVFFTVLGMCFFFFF